MKTLAEKLAYCAEVDTGLPWSLTCDAWDLIDQHLSPVYRDMFETALLTAVDAYLASPLTYEHNRRAV